MFLKKRHLSDFFLFYFSIVFPIVVYGVYIYSVFPYRDTVLDSQSDWIFFVFKMSWLAGILLVPSGLFSYFRYGSPFKDDEKNIQHLEESKWNERYRLIITYVSRGDNAEALLRSVGQTFATLRNFKVKFFIEVVTDLQLPKEMKLFYDNIYYYQVPKEYATKNHAQYKARALQYVLEQRKMNILDIENVWVFHVDEESVVTPSVIAGIHAFISKPENRNVIGQGEIKYNAYNYGENILVTAIDGIRTGDDLGRFRFQFRTIGKPLFGMHGSFILIPLIIENSVGFDLGGKGSITEDAYFALVADARGYEFGWVNGYIREQSPFSVKDLVKQRRRWLSGLTLLAFDSVLPLKSRFSLIFNLFLWKVSWIAVFVTIANMVGGGTYFPDSLVIGSAILTGGYASVYMVGVYRNLLDMHNWSWYRKTLVYVSTYILIPISACIEGFSVVYSIVNPVKGFDIVKK